MDAGLMPDDVGESKNDAPAITTKWWIALCVDVLEHEVVGPNVKSPRAADPNKQVWQPFAVWVWMLAEAAHKDRVRNMKGRHISLRRGQLAVAERYLARMANWTRKGAALFLNRLARHGMVSLSTLSKDGQLVLDFASAKRGPDKGPTLTIVTISNYDKYQHTPTRKGAAQGAARGPTRGQSLTSNTPTSMGESYQSPKEVNEKQEDLANEIPSGIDGALGERLPFTADTIRELTTLDGLDVEALVESYREKTKGKPIKNPDAYILKMGRTLVAGRMKISLEQLKRITSKNKTERALEQANVVGAFSRPSEETLRRARRYRKPEEIEQALANLAGKSFRSQDAVDRALEGEFTVLRFGRRAA